MSELRVVIVGAGRIGKQHAKWYRMAGCRVVGFLGSTEESVARTHAALLETLDLDVPGDTDLARLLADSCRETDTVARYGGDEFVVLMPGTDALGARQVLAKIDKAIEERNAAAPDETPLGASMGLQTSGCCDPEELLLAADRSMYAMKRQRAAATAE